MSNIDVDAEIRALRASRKRPIVIGLGAVVVLLAGSVLYVLTGASSVRSSLISAGYTDVEVKTNGLFEYGFTARKLGATCGGTVTRTPVSTTREESCFSDK
jgi:FlaG/FlaF family flagellin (archaellin)